MTDTKTFSQHIADLKATRDKKTEEMKTVAQKAMDEQRNMDGGESEKFETLKAEIKSIEADIKRFSELAAMDAETAKPVDDTAEREKTYTPPSVPVSVKNTEKLDKGIAFARAAKCLALGTMSQRDPVQVAKSLYSDRADIVGCVNAMVTKAVIPAANTSTPEWAGNLVQNGAAIFADFLEYLRPTTIIGRFGVDGAPEYRRVPFRVPVGSQETPGAAYWTGEGKPKGLTKFDFATRSLEPLKVATIAVATMELLRDASVDVDFIIRDSIASAVRARLDEDFINPAKAAVAGVSPASILNGAPTVASSGTNADAVRADILALFNLVAANNATMSDIVFIMPTGVAMALASMRTLAQPEFPDMTLTGGRVMGIPVIVSDYVPHDATAGSIVALVKARDILVADAGDVEISISREATLQMSDEPVDNLTAGESVVNLWQYNMVGFRAERTINWMRARNGAAAYLTGVKWSV